VTRLAVRTRTGMLVTSSGGTTRFHDGWFRTWPDTKRDAAEAFAERFNEDHPDAFARVVKLP
jgi:hypothetical protein